MSVCDRQKGASDVLFVVDDLVLGVLLRLLGPLVKGEYSIGLASIDWHFA